MSNELISLSELGVKTLEETAVAALTKTSDFLPQVRVYGGSNDIVKSGDFPIGHFGLYVSKDDILDLGASFDALVISARPRAGNVMGEKPISFFDMDSAEFIETQRLAMSKTQGYMVGLEYLLWIANLSKYALFWMGTPTLRRESNKVKALLGGAITFKIKFINPSNNPHSWHGAEVFGCETPFTVPDLEEIREQVTKFNNPENSPVELAEEDSRQR